MKSDYRSVSVSVIIPTYNASETIKRCIESVSRQSFRDLEIVVVDDGSTDDTPSIIKRINEPRLRFIELHHSGVSHARNYGLLKCRGDYVLFLDSDDTIEPNTLSRLFDYMKTNKSVDVIKFGYSVIKNSESNAKAMPRWLCDTLFDSSDKRDRDLLFDFFFRNKTTIPCYSVTLLLRRRTLIDRGLTFNENLYMMEDAVFYLDLFNSGITMRFCPDPLYNYYHNTNSATRSRADCIRIAKGAINSCSVILEGLNYPPITSLKYFKIIFEYIAMDYDSGGVIDEIVFCDKYNKIIVNADVSNDKVYWKLVKRAILKKRRFWLGVLAQIYSKTHRKEKA